MAFSSDKYDIETWLRLEEDNMLQKLCNSFDGNGDITGQYKTRISVVPSGQYHKGVESINAPSLFRAFNTDAEGKITTSPPEMREWTADCEANKIGIIPGSSILPDDGTFDTLTLGKIPKGTDFMSTSYPNTTTEIYRYYNGGAGGTLLVTATIIYTAAEKTDISTIDWV